MPTKLGKIILLIKGGIVPISGKDMVKLFLKAGYEIEGQVGSSY